MGQKIHPTGFRLSVTRNWTSRWYSNSKNFPQMLKEDIEVRDYLKKKLAHASVGRVVIERPAKNARVTVFSARPACVIGKKGEDIEHLKADLQRKHGCAGSREHRRNPQAGNRRSADRRFNCSAARKAHHVPSCHEACDAKCHAPWCPGHQDHEFRAPERCRDRPHANGIAKAVCRCIRCVPTSTTGRLRPRPPTASSVSRFGSSRVKACPASDALVPMLEPVVDDQRKPRRSPAKQIRGDAEAKPPPSDRAKAEDAKPKPSRMRVPCQRHQRQA
jgi:hypothetical protein